MLSKKPLFYIEKGTLTTPKQLVLLSVMPSDAFKGSITIDKPLCYNALCRKVMLYRKTGKKNLSKWNQGKRFYRILNKILLDFERSDQERFGRFERFLAEGD